MTVKRSRDTHPSPVAHMIRQARSGRLGDLRLLGLCAGILVLCVVGLVLTLRKPARAISVPSAGVAEIVQPANLPTAEEEASQERTPYNIAGDASSGQTPANAGVVQPPSPEEQERALRDMADQMPEGQIIVF